MPPKKGGLVYSTDPHWEQRCPRCGSHPCRCPASASVSPERQEAHIRREVKGRGGKTVTTIANLQLSPADLKALGSQLRHACGTGGTVKDGVIEVQGDHRDKVAATLRALGYRTKFAGG